MNAYQDAQTSNNNSVQAHVIIANPASRYDLRGIGPVSNGPVHHPASPFPRQEGVALLENYEQEMSVFQAEHEAELNRIQMYFVLPADASVATFLHEHRTVPQILLEAIGHLKEFFGTDTVFALRAPIDEAGSRTLYGVAMWPGAVQDARRALANFDEGWWLAHSRQASGHLTFTYELV